MSGDLSTDSTGRSLLLAEARADAVRASECWGLPFAGQRWSGSMGAERGRRSGHSLEFDDHRGYVLGDDLRHMNWNVYARTAQHVLKVFREEVSPLVDVLVDGSCSMVITPQKERRVRALVEWVKISAKSSAASQRVWFGKAHTIEVLYGEMGGEDLEWKGEVCEVSDREGETLGAGVMWRRGAMRVIVTDCLWAGDPGAWLGMMARDAGEVLLLVPYVAEESDPRWSGGIEFVDSESGEVRIQRVDSGVLESYRSAYRRHFRLWEEEARRRSIRFLRVGCEAALVDEFAAAGVLAGVVQSR